VPVPSFDRRSSLAILIPIAAALAALPVLRLAGTPVARAETRAEAAAQPLPVARRDLVAYAFPKGPARPAAAVDSATCPPDATGGLLHKAKCELNTPTTTPTPPPPTPTTPEPPVTPPTPTPPTPPPSVSPGFAYYPPGDLHPDDKKRGRADRFVYLPNMVYPLKLGEDLHPHMNSQIRGPGGYLGPGGGQCDRRNYDPMLQRDDFCELRDGRKTEMCPTGEGHQGQDIRPPKCEDKKWEVVAVVDGTISQFTSNTTVALRGADGTEYIYLHMHPSTIKVKLGSKVKQGDVLGRVSNIMGGKVGTTIHLHFEARQSIQIGTKIVSTKVPVFASLVAAYRRSKGLQTAIDADGKLVLDPSTEIGAVLPTPPTPPTPPPTPPTPPSPPTPEPPVTPTPPPTPPTRPPSPPTPEPPVTPTPPPPTPPTPPPTPPTPEPPKQEQGWWNTGWNYVSDWWGGLWKKK